MEDLPKPERLRGRERLAELFQSGARGGSATVAARALPNGTEVSRLAAVAGKKLGNAAKRNRMRRRIRAAYRMQKDALPKGWDFAVLARPGLLEAVWRDVTRDVALAIQRAVRDATGPARPARPD